MNNASHVIAHDAWGRYTRGMQTLKLNTAIFAAAAFIAAFSAGGASAANGNGEQDTPQVQFGIWGDFLAGRHAEAIGDKRGAFEFYDAATHKGMVAPAEFYSRMYILNLTEGRMEAALASLATAESMGAKAPLSSLTRAVVALRDGNYKAAEDLLESDDTGLSRLLKPTLSAWSRVGRNDIAGALAVLDKAKDATDDEKPRPLNLLHSALINDAAGNATVAEKQFSQLQSAAGLSVRSSQLFGENLERQGRASDASALYKTLNNEAAAETLLETIASHRARNIRPKLDVSTAQQGAAEALYAIASSMLAQNAYEAALAMARLSDAVRPGFPPATMIIAAVLEQDGRRTDANALYATIPKSSPFSWAARLHFANNLDLLDRTDDAIELLRSMSRVSRTLSGALVELGDIFRRHERYKDAAAAYSDALARIGEPREIHWGVFYSRGVSYDLSKEWPKAEADFLRALELSPDQPSVLNYLGYLWIDQGQHLERALKMISQAVKKRPRDGYIVDSLGWGLYRTGDFLGAVKQLERAAMLSPADPVINDHLGDAMWRVGRKREARFQWERALAMDPTPELSAVLKIKIKSGLDAAQP